MGSHSVTCHPTQVNTPRLSPACSSYHFAPIQVCTGFNYLELFHYYLVYVVQNEWQTLSAILMILYRLMTSSFHQNIRCHLLHVHRSHLTVHRTIRPTDYIGWTRAGVRQDSFCWRWPSTEICRVWTAFPLTENDVCQPSTEPSQYRGLLYSETVL